MAKKFTLLLKRLFSSTVNATTIRATDTSTIATTKLMDDSAMGTIHGTLDAIPISEKIQSLTDQVCSLNMIEVVQFTRLLKASAFI